MMSGTMGSPYQFRRLHYMSGGSSKNQSAVDLRQPKSKSGPEFLGLTRCAGCYNQNQNSSQGRGDSSETSSTSEDSSSSESESESESEAESSCSDGCSDQGLSETDEKPEAEEDSPVSAVAAESVGGGQDGDG
ncbi:nuclear localization sequence-binding protein-like [Sphaeramia orbicularis]|uniref:nuclear localization sequence-binding protein-like n=1 Tax=Sphaeramia orbicularis TaxID=375764 RepID=UPI0011813914|nr:nuclear localization sequence-binding protein-like [Sphaeramia orbicularis]XP_030012593.1 nuclear localization sequence-binding protein-like [Sphaeramia orbicularis]